MIDQLEYHKQRDKIESYQDVKQSRTQVILKGSNVTSENKMHSNNEEMV